MKKTVFCLVIVLSLGTSIYYCWAYKAISNLVHLNDNIEKTVHASEQRIMEKIETLLASSKQVNTTQSKS